MISTSDRVLVLAILLVLAVSSVAYGAEVPLSFIGTYQGESHACMGSIIVLRKKNITWDECKSKNVPYTVVEADEQHVFLELHSSDCRLPFIRLEHANSVQGELRVSGYEALAPNYALDCHYFRVDPALGEDQTASFLHGKSGTEREKALKVINQQGHPERDKYNEMSKCHLTAQSTRPPDTASAPDDVKEEQRKPLPAGHREKTCEFAGLALPESYAIFAAGNYSGRKIDFQIDKSGHQATQMDVTVNYSSKPVVLMLGAYEPTIWNIKWTATTRIAAVFVSGYHR